MAPTYRRLSIAFVLISAASLLCIDVSEAASKKGYVDIQPGDVYSAKSGKKNISCIVYNGIAQSGKSSKNNQFKLASTEVESINKKIKSFKKKRNFSQLSLQKDKLKKVKKRIKADNKACVSSAPPSNSTPVPSSDAFSMSKLERAITADDVRNLVNRAGFGLGPSEEWLISVGVNSGLDELVSQFMTTREEDSALIAKIDDMLDGQIGSSTTQTPRGQRDALFQLWTHTKNPYKERMALFLLSVWTVAGDVIGDETFRFVFWDYYKRLQRYAGLETNLPELGLEITRDPLMLIYLSNELNDKSSPNENYARELMELFTVGPEDLDGQPNYTETREDGSGDIAVAARMLTGWRIDDDYATPALLPKYLSARHANGPHTMFVGKSYQFTGENDEDLVRGIFANHPSVKNYYSKEILKEYLTPDPSRELIEAFGRIIAENSYNLRPAMATLFKSKAFYHPSYRHTLSKNSIEFAVEAVKVLAVQDDYDLYTVDDQLEKMGMPVNESPSVFWFNPSGWTSAAISLERSNLVGALLSDMNALNTMPAGSASSSAVIDYIAARLGIDSIPDSVRSSLDSYMNRSLQYDNTYQSVPYNNTDADIQRRKGSGVYYLLMSTPDFQLK